MLLGCFVCIQSVAMQSLRCFTFLVCFDCALSVLECSYAVAKVFQVFRGVCVAMPLHFFNLLTFQSIKMLTSQTHASIKLLKSVAECMMSVLNLLACSLCRQLTSGSAVCFGVESVNLWTVVCVDCSMPATVNQQLDRSAPLTAALAQSLSAMQHLSYNITYALFCQPMDC